MSIHIDSCAARETIVVNTRSSVYELIVLRAPNGEVLVCGGGHFPEFRRVLFIGSTVDGGSLEPRTIEIGHRMQFICDDQLVTTSAVQSVSLEGLARTAVVTPRLRLADLSPSAPAAHRDRLV